MAHQASLAVKEALTARNINCEIAEGGGSSAVITGFDLKNGDKATFHFISLGDSNDVALRVFRFAKVPPEQKEAALDTMNELNCRFRYAKFTLRDEGEVNMEMDMPQETTDVGRVAFEMLVRSLDILADASVDLRALGAVIGETGEDLGGPGPAPETPEEPKKKHSFFRNGK